MAKNINNADSLDSLISEANANLGGDSTPAKVAEAPISVNDPVMVAASRKYNELESKRKALVYKYRNEKKVPVTISPFYAPYLGRVVRVSVNGIIVDIPADGQSYMINQTHADHILAKIKRIDAMIARQKRAGDVANNFEHSPGELHL